ncbi:MAG: lipopolysaccharide transport periplasmic protein LptA [Aquirhabdus sp.]
MLQLNISRTVQTKLAIPFLSFLIVSALATTAHALDSDRDQPVNLEADHATYNQQTGITVYSGNVIITQGTIRIQADNVVANLDATRSIKDVTATGKPAKFQQKISPDKGIAYGEGDQVYYDAALSQITLTGHAKITQDGSSFNGNTLRYGMKQGDIEGNGNKQQRVQMIIPPNASRVSTTVKSK